MPRGGGSCSSSAFIYFFISSFLAQEFYPAGWGGGAQKEILGNFPMDLGWTGPREVLLEAGPALGSHQGSIVLCILFFPLPTSFPRLFRPIPVFPTSQILSRCLGMNLDRFPA